MSQDRRRPVERQVRDDAERLPRELDRSGVCAHDLDVLPAVPQPRSQAPVQLDRDDPPRGGRQRLGQPAGAGPEVEYEIVAADPGVANELRSERARAEEMLTTRAAGPARSSCARLGHGPSRS
jgi:hypothetical protein